MLGPGWQWHYYAHLDRFADIKPGSIVQPGTVLGYVGNIGNASGTPLPSSLRRISFPGRSAESVPVACYPG
ncbi:MAG TPA: M23 family metallopeptidase [Blastocatellia bacterium]|nr:M23 family metallopeptidase [Blastocatellia bacterium]